MSRMIGLDFEGDRVTAVELAGGKPPLVGATFQATLPGSLSVKNSESLGNWLKEGLAKAGFRAADAVVVLSRGRMNIKLLDVPAGPADELPAMVTFSVEGELAAPSGEGVLDFQSASNGDGATVLAAMASAEEVNAIAAMVKAAKLNCRHIAPRAYADHFAAEQSFDLFGHHATLVVAPQAGLVEISAWRTDNLTAYRSIPLSTGEDPGKRILAEIRRTLAAVRSGDRPLAADRIGVVGNGVELAQAIKDSTQMPVLHIDPCATFSASDLSNQPGYTSAMVAAWRELVDADWPLDFLKPKRPIVKRDTRRPVLIMGAALALLLPIGGYSYAKYLNAVKTNRIAYLAQQVQVVEAENAKLRPTVQRHDVIKQWTDGDVNWIHELQALAAVLPDTTDAFIRQIDMHSNEGRAEGQKPGTITIEGLAKDQSIMNEANSRNAADATGHYAPTPRGSNFTTERVDYQHSFKVDLAVTPLKDKEYLELKKTGHERFAKSIPEGKRRDPVALGNSIAAKTAAGSTSTVLRTDQRTGASTTETGGRNNRGNRSNVTGTEEPAAATVDPVDRFVATIKSLSFEEREKFINGKVPSFLRAKVRKKLNETKQ